MVATCLGANKREQKDTKVWVNWSSGLEQQRLLQRVWLRQAARRNVSLFHLDDTLEGFTGSTREWILISQLGATWNQQQKAKAVAQSTLLAVLEM